MCELTDCLGSTVGWCVAALARRVPSFEMQGLLAAEMALRLKPFCGALGEAHPRQLKAQQQILHAVALACCICAG